MPKCKNTNNGKPNDIKDTTLRIYELLSIISVYTIGCKCSWVFSYDTNGLLTTKTSDTSAYKVYNVMNGLVTRNFCIGQKHCISQVSDLFEKRFFACVT